MNIPIYRPKEIREIKFREFYKKENIMYRDIDISNECLPIHDDNVVIMQYTGLKDKNKKEIYNDDLLEDDKCRLFQVIQDNRIGKTGYIMRCVKNRSGKDHIEIDNIYDFWSWLFPDNYLEVIGNIYENPELLELE